jgi:hypothetical protein
MIPTKTKSFFIREAEADDVPLILAFIKDLAAYEKLSHEVVATEALLEETLFGERRTAEVLIGEHLKPLSRQGCKHQMTGNRDVRPNFSGFRPLASVL